MTTTAATAATLRADAIHAITTATKAMAANVDDATATDLAARALEEAASAMRWLSTGDDADFHLARIRIAAARNYVARIDGRA